MPDPIELTDEELAIVAGGVSLSGSSLTAFTGGIGTLTTSIADATTSTTSAVNGGTIGAATLANFTLTASPPGS